MRVANRQKRGGEGREGGREGGRGDLPLLGLSVPRWRCLNPLRNSVHLGTHDGHFGCIASRHNYQGK